LGGQKILFARFAREFTILYPHYETRGTAPVQEAGGGSTRQSWVDTSSLVCGLSCIHWKR